MNENIELNIKIKILQQVFNKEFYLKKYPDVAKAGIDPILHFINHGINEMRDISPDFSMSEVLSETLENQLEYILEFVSNYDLFISTQRENKYGFGHHECRTCESIKKYSDIVILDQLFERFDTKDLIKFLCENGNKYDINIRKNFSTSAYLTNYEDVKDSGIFALSHYVDNGVYEGRKNSSPENLIYKNRFKEVLNSFNEINNASQNVVKLSNAKECALTPLSKLARQFEKYSANRSEVQSLLLCVSHDNPSASIGGVQLIVKNALENAFAKHTLTISVFPFITKSGYDDIGEDDQIVGLSINLENVVYLKIGTLYQFLMNIDIELTELQIHHLFGFNRRSISLLSSLDFIRKIIYIHDHSFICDGYNLLRNGLSYCGAPDATSKTCGGCMHSDSRLVRNTIYTELELKQFQFIAPSKSIRRLANKSLKLKAGTLKLVPHWMLVPCDESSHDKSNPSEVRVAYCGHAVFHKGYDVWVDLCKKLYLFPHVKFLFFGSQKPYDLPSNCVFIHYQSSSVESYELKRQLLVHDVSVAVFPSMCPEAFGFVMHEAAASGAHILTVTVPPQPISALDSENIHSVPIENVLSKLITIVNDILMHGFTRRPFIIRSNMTDM